MLLPATIGQNGEKFKTSYQLGLCTQFWCMYCYYGGPIPYCCLHLPGHHKTLDSSVLMVLRQGRRELSVPSSKWNPQEKQHQGSEETHRQKEQTLVSEPLPYHVTSFITWDLILSRQTWYSINISCRGREERRSGGREGGEREGGREEMNEWASGQESCPLSEAHTQSIIHVGPCPSAVPSPSGMCLLLSATTLRLMNWHSSFI